MRRFCTTFFAGFGLILGQACNGNDDSNSLPAAGASGSSASSAGASAHAGKAATNSGGSSSSGGSGNPSGGNSSATGGSPGGSSGGSAGVSAGGAGGASNNPSDARVQCGDTECDISAGDVCCYVPPSDKAVAQSSCAKRCVPEGQSAPQNLRELHCDGHADCSSSAPVCCIKPLLIAPNASATVCSTADKCIPTSDVLGLVGLPLCEGNKDANDCAKGTFCQPPENFPEGYFACSAPPR